MLPINVAQSLLSDYAIFTKKLMWFRAYCAGNFGRSIKDYVEGHESLRRAYQRLINHTARGGYWDDSVVRDLLRKIGIILYSSKVTTSDLLKIGQMIGDFEEKDEDRFRKQ